MSVFVVVTGLLADDDIVPPIWGVMQFFNKPEFINAKKEFYYQEITNTSINPAFKATFIPSSFWENQLHQKKSIKEFEDKIEYLLTDNQSTDEAYQNSTIIKPLIRKLSSLQGNEQKNIVLLFCTAAKK